ncbi:MAG TPA: aspartyl protease family protein [Pyrinomonadaceae bacterium]|nr:aspartyl protease family protein [Pyrinomonadaceae bacterium]
MKIELCSSIPCLQVRINGSDPLWFLLDTGAQVTVIDNETARLLGLNSEGSFKGEGGGEGTIEVSLVNDITITLADLSVTIAMAAVAPIRSLLESHMGRRVHGVLGYDLISQYVIEIDYAAKEITFNDPANYQHSGKGEVVPIAIANNHPHIRATIFHFSEQAIEADFVVDTCASSELSLATAFVNKYRFIESGTATHQALVVGAGGIALTPVGRVERVQVGSFIIDRPVAYFSQDKGGAFGGLLGADGIIGAEFLRRFTVIFDYPGEKMILEPNNHFNEPYEGDAISLTGMSVTAEGDDLKTFRINTLLEQSPAAIAGIKEEDIILAVDGTPASNIDLEQLCRCLIKQKKVQLSVKRADDYLDVAINITRPI